MSLLGRLQHGSDRKMVGWIAACVVFAINRRFQRFVMARVNNPIDPHTFTPRQELVPCQLVATANWMNRPVGIDKERLRYNFAPLNFVTRGRYQDFSSRGDCDDT